jgi:hypothetical protein
MNGKYLSKSWEKQQFYLLDNDVEVCVEWNQCYGDFIKAAFKNKIEWFACDGVKTLPEEFSFLLDWQEIVNETSETKLIRPKFNKVYK